MFFFEHYYAIQELNSRPSEYFCGHSICCIAADRFLTRAEGALRSGAMRDDDPVRPAAESAEKDPSPALKKPSADRKRVETAREARLEAALRENLRRRKAAGRKDIET